MSNPLQNAVSRLRSILIDNWPIKLTALILAAMLWAAVAAQEPTTQLVPVRLRVTPPPGRSVIGTLPDVHALFSGTPRELIKLYAQTPAIDVRLPDTIMGSSYLLELHSGDITFAEGAAVNAQQVEPQSIRIVLDDVARSVVPVVHRVTIEPDSGYRIFGGVATSPSSITVQGPQDRVTAVNMVSTVPLALTAVRAPVRRRVAVDTASLSGLRLSQTTVLITADVGALADRVLDGVRVTVDADDPSAWVVEPLAVNVTVRGRESRTSALTRDSVRVVVSPRGAAAEGRAALEVLAPQGITAWAIPDSVTVRREGSD